MVDMSPLDEDVAIGEINSADVNALYAINGSKGLIAPPPIIGTVVGDKICLGSPDRAFLLFENRRINLLPDLDLC